jgi:glucose-6-phosphate 1-epimerase
MGPITAASLERFTLPGVVAITTDAGGLNRVVITNAHAQAEIHLMGAQCTRFQPVGEQPVLWLSAYSRFSAGVPIRGGIPLCWPWFGAHPMRADLGAHGFARTAQWTLERTAIEAGGETTVELTLASSPATRTLWPHDFHLSLVITVGAALSLALTVRNTGVEAFTCDEALHTYLTVADVRAVSITGLQGTTYIDKVRQGQQFRQDQPLAIDAEIDRIYLDTTATVDVMDPGLQRTLRVAKSGSSATVVWNPHIAKAKAMADFGDQEWLRMLCVETANVSRHALTIAAGEVHVTRMTLSLVH